MAQDEATRKALLDKNRNHSRNENDMFDAIALRNMTTNYVES